MAKYKYTICYSCWTQEDIEAGEPAKRGIRDECTANSLRDILEGTRSFDWSYFANYNWETIPVCEHSIWIYSSIRETFRGDVKTEYTLHITHEDGSPIGTRAWRAIGRHLGLLGDKTLG